MIIRGQIDVDRLLAWGEYERGQELAADWQDEGSQASLDKNPRRGFYLDHMAQRVPYLMGAEQRRQAEARREFLGMA